MKNKLVTSVLLVGCVLLLGVSVLLQKEEDRIAPVIQVKQSAITYTEGEDYDKLLEGVVAKDNCDGDITDEIFVEKILKMEEGKKALVRYAVLDRAKNIGVAERKVAYKGKEEQKQEQPKQEEEKQEQQNEKSDVVHEGNPVIRLKMPTVTIKKGSKFSPLSYVSTVEDDKDEQSALYKRIHIDGKYNTRVSGTYTLQYSVKDQEGNLSNTEKFTLIVQ